MKRFVNRDIIAGSIEDSRSLNRYAYCCGNPVSYADPFGLSPLVSIRNHAVLDVIGLLPVIGVAADLVNAAMYLAEGNAGAAAMSAVFAVIPSSFAGGVAMALGATKMGAGVVQAVVSISICTTGVYANASQVSDDIDRMSANWDSYSDEERELEKQIIICDILGLAGSAAGSMSGARELSRMDVYQTWETDLEKPASNFADDNSGSADIDALFGKVSSEGGSKADTLAKNRTQGKVYEQQELGFHKIFNT